ncbi:hypothetical protein WH47_02256 [Habropoda laboriosa]|uniref:Uncharacterized protein n=1 Tax=Habropoda laboriosa TaxID=597456 RepID=A0A0L7QZS0_9HYME|nr:hypothetical protein WH47_02256 [Habropoda laboriosa]
MDISEDCWDHVGLLQEVSGSEPPPPPPAPDFLIQQQEVSSRFFLYSCVGRRDSVANRFGFDGEKSAGDRDLRVRCCDDGFSFAVQAEENGEGEEEDRQGETGFFTATYWSAIPRVPVEEDDEDSPQRGAVYTERRKREGEDEKMKKKKVEEEEDEEQGHTGQ